MILQLHVQPGAKRSEFAGEHGGRMKLRLAAPPVEGARRNVRIAAGLRSRRKRVVIEGV